MITNLHTDQTIPQCDRHALLCVPARPAVSPAELLHRASAIRGTTVCRKDTTFTTLPKDTQYKAVDSDLLIRAPQETPTLIVAENSGPCDAEPVVTEGCRIVKAVAAAAAANVTNRQ